MDITISDKAWGYFKEFWNERHDDWTDEQIDYAYNNDDIEQFLDWLCDKAMGQEGRIEALEGKIKALERAMGGK